MAFKEKQVLIPCSVFQDLIELLNWLSSAIDDSLFNLDFEMEHKLLHSLQALHEKNEKAQLRKTYTKMIVANTEDERHFARMDYLIQKRSAYGRSFAE